MIEANWGDTIQVTVNNQITGPEEGTSLHWHGFLQKQTPYYDGVPAVGQCPIAPNSSLTYSFHADLYGTSWYHSHYSAQYAAGISGPIVIHGPTQADYDIDIGPVMLSDWYHTTYYDLVEQTLAPGAIIPPLSDNNLINGKNNFNCSDFSYGEECIANAGISKFAFQTGKVHRLRLINSGAEGIQQFSIDDHNMTIIANDFVPVQPYPVTSVTLGVGQRTDVLVTGNSNSNGSYFMRSTLVCALAKNTDVIAAIYYPDANTNSTPTSVAPPFTPQCSNDPLTSTTPYYDFGALPNSSVSQQIDITLAPNASNIYLWYMNNVTFRANYDNPILLLANTGNVSYPQDPEWNVYNFGSNTSVRLLVYNHVPVAYHPMHLHGHNMFVLSTGTGTWNGSISNPTNPQRRDTQILPPATGGDSSEPGYIVVQFAMDNPGVWPFHCHIAWHVSAGLYINVLERPADIQALQIPAESAQTCRDWASFAGHDVVDQIDSGL
ncbi:MAG: hypothetical protein LQ340_001632 [Diploschistes diacapsis]|nr:MAG: hypothetical protein LQ340_001632 [Diploschistes diacapsis]